MEVLRIYSGHVSGRSLILFKNQRTERHQIIPGFWHANIVRHLICPVQLLLPNGVTVEVIVVNIVSAGHLFVQQHTHPTYHALRSLDQQMYLCYSQPGTPPLPSPVEGKMLRFFSFRIPSSAENYSFSLFSSWSDLCSPSCWWSLVASAGHLLLQRFNWSGNPICWLWRLWPCQDWHPSTDQVYLSLSFFLTFCDIIHFYFSPLPLISVLQMCKMCTLYCKVLN